MARAEFAAQITERVQYGLPGGQEPDEIRYYATRADLLADLDRMGVPGSEQHGSQHQYQGWRIEWGVAREDAGFICRCGCTEVVKKDGGFRPGHDARLVGNLVRKVRQGDMKKADALALLADRPKLADKLARYLAK